MEINDAVAKVEEFLESYKNQHDDWNPTEIRVLPSGDDMDAIKILINFGPDADESAIDGLKDRAIDELKKTHSDVVDGFELHARALAD